MVEKSDKKRRASNVNTTEPDAKEGSGGKASDRKAPVSAAKSSAGKPAAGQASGARTSGDKASGSSASVSAAKSSAGTTLSSAGLTGRPPLPEIPKKRTLGDSSSPVEAKKAKSEPKTNQMATASESSIVISDSSSDNEPLVKKLKKSDP